MALLDGDLEAPLDERVEGGSVLEGEALGGSDAPAKLVATETGKVGMTRTRAIGRGDRLAMSFG